MAIPGLTRLGVLREGTERVLQVGFSPDGNTIFTQDTDSVLRFWNADGTLRAKTPLRPERFIYPAGMKLKEINRIVELANPILVSDGVALLRSAQPDAVKSGRDVGDWTGQSGAKGACDLYSTHTGKFLRRLDRPGRFLSSWEISPDKRWLIYTEETVDEQGKRQPDKSITELVVLSTVDGRELTRLKHPGTKPDLVVSISPLGKWMLTYRVNQKFVEASADVVKLWRTSDWSQVKDAALDEALAHIKGSLVDPYFVTDDIFALSWDGGVDAIFAGIIRIGKPGSWTPKASLEFHVPDWDRPRGELGGTLLRQGRVLLTADPIQRLKPPYGRKYHPRLAELAPDARFWESLDTVTEKDLPYSFDGKYFPGFGGVGVREYYEKPDDQPRTYDDTELRILPDPKRLDFPPEMVELWAQVVVGGELSPEGTFQPWDQPTWAAKQRQLAAFTPPYADFPFPGWAATEPHLWHRIRANEVNKREERIAEWRRLTGRTRPDLGPDKWRTVDVAPQPQMAK